jgi:hypothetical protein
MNGGLCSTGKATRSSGLYEGITTGNRQEELRNATKISIVVRSHLGTRSVHAKYGQQTTVQKTAFIFELV